MKLFLLVSDRRSGTNNLGYMLGQHPEFLSAGEIFHPRTTFGGFEFFEEYRDYFGARIGLAPGLAEAERDAAISRYTHARPRETVEALLDFARAKGKTYAIFKVFPGHLRHYQLDGIIGRFRPEVLFLLRTPLEAYVSLQKANALETWMLADTTGMRVTIDPEDFVAWHRRVSAFYRFAISACLARGRHPRLVHYDAIYRSRLTPREALERLFRQMGVRFGPEFGTGAVNSLPVQDRGGDVLEAIDDPDAFLAQLAKRDEAHRLYQFDLFGRLPYLEYASRALLGPLRPRRGRPGINLDKSI